MGRVERQNYRLYRQRIENQRKAYLLNLSKINKYLSDLKVENKRRFDVLANYNKKLKQPKPQKGSKKQSPPRGVPRQNKKPTFRPMREVIIKPTIKFKKIPTRSKRIRSNPRRRLKNLRRAK